MAKWLEIFLHTWAIRDLIASAGPVAFLAVGLLVAAYWWLDPQPPKTVRLATGPEGSAYAGFGKRYATALAREGITVELIPTEGSVANLQLLREGKADVAFVRGGSGAAPVTANGSGQPTAPDGAASAAVPAEPPASEDDTTLLSLGALFYEPLWIFYRPQALATPVDAAQAPSAAASGSKRVKLAGSGVVPSAIIFRASASPWLPTSAATSSSAARSTARFCSSSAEWR